MKRILLFDGECNLCHGSVQFIILRDPQKKIKFASIQSDFGQLELNKFEIKSSDLNTVYYIENDTIYSQSDAILKVVQHLTYPYPLFRIFNLVPCFIRNFIYSIISKHRYNLFGKKTSCWIPSEDLKDRFF